MLYPELLLAAFGEWFYSSTEAISVFRAIPAADIGQTPPLSPGSLWQHRWLISRDEKASSNMRLGYIVCSCAVHVDLLSGSVYPEIC